MKRKTKKQEWHDRVVDLAIEMGRSRHTGTRRGLYVASHWLHRAGDRMRDGLDVYTGCKKAAGKGEA